MPLEKPNQASRPALPANPSDTNIDISGTLKLLSFLAELTNWPSSTHKRTKLEHGYTETQAGRAFWLSAPRPVQVRNDVKQVITAIRLWLCQHDQIGPIFYAANPVGMRN